MAEKASIREVPHNNKILSIGGVLAIIGLVLIGTQAVGLIGWRFTNTVGGIIFILLGVAATKFANKRKYNHNKELLSQDESSQVAIYDRLNGIIPNAKGRVIDAPISEEEASRRRKEIRSKVFEKKREINEREIMSDEEEEMLGDSTGGKIGKTLRKTTRHTGKIKDLQNLEEEEKRELHNIEHDLKGKIKVIDYKNNLPFDIKEEYTYDRQSLQSSTEPEMGDVVKFGIELVEESLDNYIGVTAVNVEYLHEDERALMDEIDNSLDIDEYIDDIKRLINLKNEDGISDQEFIDQSKKLITDAINGGLGFSNPIDYVERLKEVFEHGAISESEFNLYKMKVLDQPAIMEERLNDLHNRGELDERYYHEIQDALGA